MDIRFASVAAAVLALWLPLAAHAAGQNAKPPSSARHISMNINDVHYRVVFHDAHGKTIGLYTFTAGAKRQQRFTQTLDKQTGIATLTLLPLGVNKSGSEPTSIWIALTAPVDTSIIPKPGTTFPAFDLPQVDGGHMDTATYKDKPYLVDFFFADCVGCIAELPMLNAYHQQHPSLRVLALTYDDAKTAAGFVKQRHFAWPVAYNGNAFIQKLGIKVYPTLVLVGADGKVLATRVAYDDTATLQSFERWVAKGLAAAPPTAPH